MARRATILTAMLVGTVLGLSVPAGAQLVPLGSQFEANTYTPNFQGYPAVAADGAGNFVVVWRGSGSEGGYDNSGSSIQGQRFNGASEPLGPEFQVNTYTTGYQGAPAVATREDGSFVVMWTSPGSAGSDSSNTSIQGQRYDAAGAPLDAEFQVNTYTTNYQGASSVAMDANGGFVVVWVSNGSPDSDTSFGSIQGRRYDASGAPLGSQFQVNTYTTSFQGGPSVAANEDGSFFVAWASNGSADSDTSFGSVQGRRYDASGAPLGSQFQINTYTPDGQGDPRVAVDRDGNFVVVWMSTGSAGSDTSFTSIQGQHYDATGAPLGAEFQVNSYTTSTQQDAEVAWTDDGGFVVTWESSGSPGTDNDALSIQAQRYDVAGSRVGGQFQVNSYTASGQYNPAIATDAAGNVIIAWNSNGSAGAGPDQSSHSVQTQRYVVARTVLGKKLLVKNPTSDESERAVVVFGQEAATDIGPSVVGDPTVSGATLQVIASGSTDSVRTYQLDASGWRTAGSVGYRYAGPTADGDPVKKVLIKRTPGGKALLKAILSGSVGTRNLDVVPPNLGEAGGIVLSIPGGGTYCASFGGTAGGTEVEDTPQLWRVTNATAEGCPTAP